MDADVVVIGAGALGLSTALHCALLDRSVVVVERVYGGLAGVGPGGGAVQVRQADELRTRLAQRSMEKVVSFADWAGVPLQVARSGAS